MLQSALISHLNFLSRLLVMAKNDLNVCSRNIKTIQSYYEILVIYCFNGAKEMGRKLCEKNFRMTQTSIFLYFPSLFHSPCFVLAMYRKYGVLFVNLLPSDLHFIAAKNSRSQNLLKLFVFPIAYQRFLFEKEKLFATATKMVPFRVRKLANGP